MTKYSNNAKIFKAFCDENRLKILEKLQNGDRYAYELLEALPIGQSTLSHHMKILCKAGIVKGRREGKWMYYAIDPEGCRQAAFLLKELTRLGRSVMGAAI